MFSNCSVKSCISFLTLVWVHAGSSVGEPPYYKLIMEITPVAPSVKHGAMHESAPTSSRRTHRLGQEASGTRVHTNERDTGDDVLVVGEGQEWRPGSDSSESAQAREGHPLAAVVYCAKSNEGTWALLYASKYIFLRDIAG